jgi:hypothetical protein
VQRSGTRGGGPAASLPTGWLVGGDVSDCEPRMRLARGLPAKRTCDFVVMRGAGGRRAPLAGGPGRWEAEEGRRSGLSALRHKRHTTPEQEQSP